MTDKKTATEIAKDLRDFVKVWRSNPQNNDKIYTLMRMEDTPTGERGEVAYVLTGEGLLETAEKLLTQATAIRAMNNTVQEIVTEVEKYESVTSSENTITIDLDTGEWISASPITSEQGERVAASVLPGVTPEQVREWYDNWITEESHAEEGQ